MALQTFSASVLGMMSQSAAMDNISKNIANMNTGGYKKLDTDFRTVASKMWDHNQSDIGGVLPTASWRVDQSGFIQSSSSYMDIAINGNGMFVLNNQSDGSGDTYYGRDGKLQLGGGGATGEAPDSAEAYLTDKNGYYLMGWEVDSSGATTSTTLSGMRIDPEAFTGQGTATSAGSFSANLAADLDAGSIHSSAISAYDSAGTKQTFNLIWTKQPTVNTWELTVQSNSGGTVTAPAAGIPVTFNGDGSLATPAAGEVAIAGTFGTDTASFTLDISEMTQFAGTYHQVGYEYDGQSTASLETFEFTRDGYVVGRFTDATTRPLYRMPLATFPNMNGLAPVNGNVWEDSVDAGDATIAAAGSGSVAEFVPFAYELSNVRVDEEFTKMIMTQHAYSAAATTFKTADEMLSVAKDLKR